MSRRRLWSLLCRELVWEGGSGRGAPMGQTRLGSPLAQALELTLSRGTLRVPVLSACPSSSLPSSSCIRRLRHIVVANDRRAIRRVGCLSGAGWERQQKGERDGGRPRYCAAAEIAPQMHRPPTDLKGGSFPPSFCSHQRPRGPLSLSHLLTPTHLHLDSHLLCTFHTLFNQSVYSLPLCAQSSGQA